MKSEAKVGFFVFLGLVMLFLLATQVGSFKNLSKKGYEIYANLEDATGLDVNSKIKANGINIGYIKSLKIDKDKIKAALFIYDNVKIPENSTISPVQESLLGGRYLALRLGTSSNSLNEHDYIKNGKKMADINEASNSIAQAAVEFKALTKEIRSVLNGESRKNLRLTFANLEHITAELKRFTQLDQLKKTTDSFNQMAEKLSNAGDSFKKVADELNKKLPSILQNVDYLVSNLKQTSSMIRDKVPDLATNLDEVGMELSDLIKNNKQPIHKAVKAADNFFTSGQGTFAKIDNLLKKIDKVKLEVAMYEHYLNSDEEGKGYLDLNYIPSDTKSYLFSVVSKPDYSRMDNSGFVIKPKKHEDSDILFSAQIAKRFDDIRLRTGIIENTGGLGADYFMFDDNLKMSAEIFDFNAVDDVRGSKPHAKVGLRYTLLKHLDLYGGYDNFLNKRADNIYAGIGVRFYDDDLKTLIMSQSLGNMAKK